MWRFPADHLESYGSEDESRTMAQINCLEALEHGIAWLPYCFLSRPASDPDSHLLDAFAGKRHQVPLARLIE